MGNTNVKPHPKPRNRKQLRWKGADRPAPPGRPSLLESGSLPDAIHICWTEPVKDGGSTITSYLVEHRRVGTSHWLPSSTQPIIVNELNVNGLEPGWRYQFRVRAQNGVGLSDFSEISEPFTVTLQRSAIAAPKFTQELQDAVALENDKVEFEIHFLGQPLPTICWFKNGFEIFSGNRTRITTVSDRSVLAILHVTSSDEGEIKCTATNRAGHTVTKCRLTVDAPPTIKLPKSYQDPDGIIFEIGETIKMNVAVSGKPTPLIFWSHDGESIQNNDRYDIEYNDKVSSVKIENASRSDRGEYRIKAVNKLGQDQASFLVTITDKPTPPGKARVLLTSGRSVTLSWSTPEDDGGCRVGNYIIEYYRIGWDVWLKAATTRQQSTMLGDLIEGSQYKFRVKAESPYGVSEPSEESEVVFIPDQKRGIQEPSDIKYIDNDNRLSLSKRRRANSTPRVSFVLKDDAPVRPERKKTGKTPEASPRFKRKQMPLSKNSLGSEPALNRKFSIPYSFSSASVGTSWSSSPTSKLQNVPSSRTTIINVEKHKSPSPEIIITDTDSEVHRTIKTNKNLDTMEKTTNDSLNESPSESRNTLERSLSRSPTLLKSSPPRSPADSDRSPSRSPIQFEKSPSISPEELEAIRSSNSLNNRSRTSKSLSRSPEEPKKSPFRYPGYQEKPINPLNSNSPQKELYFEAARPGIIAANNMNTNVPDKKLRSDEPNEIRQSDKRSPEKGTKFVGNENIENQNIKRMRPPLTHQPFSGSSEFMLVLCPEGEQGTRFKKFGITFDDNSVPPPLSLSAPELGIEPPEQPYPKRWSSSTELLPYRLMERLHGAAFNENSVSGTKATHLNIPQIRVNSESSVGKLPDDKLIINRKLSGYSSNNTTTWSKKRHSLKNEIDMSDVLGMRLHKFEETELMRREVQDYRRISESENVEQENENPKTNLVNDEEWMRYYEESIPSEEESEPSSSEERRNSITAHPRNHIEIEDEEIYNPRNRTISAAKVDNSQPFEILTVRKNPPDSSIVPKPILKKTIQNTNAANASRNTSLFGGTSESKPKEKDHLPERYRSSSLNETTEDEIDLDLIKASTSKKRRSFSFMPTHGNFITDAFKSKNHKKGKANIPDTKDGITKNISALASSTRIAGAGFILPNEVQDKKEIEEEAKVVVDFYGDIVKSFGGKSKPTAEFSRSLVSKYDTYEERKIADIKPNADSLATHNIRPVSPKNYNLESIQNSPNITHDNMMNSISESSNLREERKSPIRTEGLTLKQQKSSNEIKSNISMVDSSSLKDTTSGIDEALKQMKAEITRSSLMYQKDFTPSGKRNVTEVSKTYRNKSRTGRPGSRTSSVGRRRKTPMSRDASTSPLRFSDDWDSQCSSKTSLEQDYYNRGSLSSSRASSLSRRSISPPRPRLRGITTQTSFRIETKSSVDVEKERDLMRKAEERMSFVFGYFTDAAMIGVASWLYLFQNEYLAIPFIIIPIYRQMNNKIKKMKEGIKSRLPRWIRRRLGKES